MSLEKARIAVGAAKLSDHDRKWFPSWLAKYAAICNPSSVRPQLAKRLAIAHGWQGKPTDECR